jgi:drug/metabolite transporter superfamily protein YnfA
MDVLSSRVLLHPTDPERSRVFYRDRLGLAIHREFGSGPERGTVFLLGGGFLEAMTVLRSILLLVLAALAEIGGAWLVWQGTREHRGLAFVGAGILALGMYGFVATFQSDPHFGRILAAYGGVFVAGSLARWPGA